MGALLMLTETVRLSMDLLISLVCNAKPKTLPSMRMVMAKGISLSLADIRTIHHGVHSLGGKWSPDDSTPVQKISCVYYTVSLMLFQKPAMRGPPFLSKPAPPAVSPVRTKSLNYTS